EPSSAAAVHEVPVGDGTPRHICRSAFSVRELSACIMRAERSPTEWMIRWLAGGAAHRLGTSRPSITCEVEQQVHGCSALYPFARWVGLAHDYTLDSGRRRGGHGRDNA